MSEEYVSPTWHPDTAQCAVSRCKWYQKRDRISPEATPSAPDISTSCAFVHADTLKWTVTVKQHWRGDTGRMKPLVTVKNKILIDSHIRPSEKFRVQHVQF
jgi:hypothetical protein